METDSTNCAEESMTENVEQEIVTEDVEKELPEGNTTEAGLINESESKKKKKKKHKNIIVTDSTNCGEEIVTEEVKKEPSEASPTEAGLMNESEPKKKKKKKHKNKIETNSTNPAEEIVTEGVKKEPAKVNPAEDLPGSDVRLEIQSSCSFDSLKGKICEETLKAITKMGFTTLTEIQARSIPPLLEGHDLIGGAKTGSGKTLAFLIPAIELIYKLKFMPEKGTGVVILSPTRELSMQTYSVLKELLQYHQHTCGLVMGRTTRQTEAQKLSKGINILVATPGRLLDHMQNTADFLYKNLQCLVIDEADKILDIGFEEDVKQILKLLPNRSQTMLFSATQTKKTEALTSLAFKKDPIYVGVNDTKEISTVNGLEHGYIVCPSDKKLLFLFRFLKLKQKKKMKIMVFFSTCMTVKYYNELFNYIDLPVTCLHGKQSQEKRTSRFFEFCNADSGVLLCTDVAARGLDIPKVDWIVQYDPPDDPKEYIHRVGRTARGEGCKGFALMILRPEEVGFLMHLKVPLNDFEFEWSKIEKLDHIQLQIEGLITENRHLQQSAREAFISFIGEYKTRHLKRIFNIRDLDPVKVGKSFGFKVPPAVNIRCLGKKSYRPEKRKGGSIFHHPKRQKSSDTRQFSR